MRKHPAKEHPAKEHLHSPPLRVNLCADERA